ncbi:hypothetical protein QYF36_000671 [Acer negundo]|nr:hypothetical protein QYF36_000671 [Acer negundo]
MVTTMMSILIGRVLNDDNESSSSRFRGGATTNRHGGGATRLGGGAKTCSDDGNDGDAEPSERREANLMCSDDGFVPDVQRRHWTRLGF